MSNSLQVVPSALLVTNMGADGRVSCRASQVLAFAERNVLTLGVLVALSETEINDVDVVFSALITSNQKVVWLDITMNDPLFVHFLNSVDLPTPHEKNSQSRINVQRKGKIELRTDSVSNMHAPDLIRNSRMIALTI